MAIKEFIIAAVLIIAGISLLFVGIYMPPQGEIAPSVLVAYGETLTFVGSLVGIDYNYRSKKGGHNEQRE